MLICILIFVLHIDAAHRLYSAFFNIQLQYCTMPDLISFSRLIMVLQLSETVVILVIHKA